MADLFDLRRSRLPYRQVTTSAFEPLQYMTDAVAASPLFISPKLIPKLTQATLFFSVTGFFIVFCMLLGLKKQTQPNSFITESGLGTSGWSPGTAWVLAVGNAL